MPSENAAGADSLPSYATLINLKKVLPAANLEYFAVEKHMFYSLMKGFVDRIFIDQDWYLQKYPDIRTAIDSRAVQNARDHYIRHGYFEHRLPYRIDVDAAWYRQTYADVRAAIDRGLFKSPQDHFELEGFREGRLPFPNFSLRVRAS